MSFNGHKLSMIVEHPETGAKIDVAPLFEALEQLDGPANSPADAARVIGETIRLINLSETDIASTTYQSTQSHFADLYLLQDMFSRMAA